MKVPRHSAGSFPILFVYDKDGASGTGIAAWHAIRHREGDYDRRIRDIFETWRPEILQKLAHDSPRDFRPDFRATDYALIECQRTNGPADDIDFVSMNRRLAGFHSFRDVWDAIDRADLSSARAITLIAAIAEYIDRFAPGHHYSDTLADLFVSATVIDDSLTLGPVVGGHWKRAAVAITKRAGESATFYVAPDTPTDVRRLVRLPDLLVSPAALETADDVRAIIENEVTVVPVATLDDILDRHWPANWRAHLSDAMWQDFDRRTPSTRSAPRTAVIRPPEAVREPYFRHRHSLQSNFTGRIAERKILTEWLTNGTAPVLSLTGIGGMGKSSLLWVWVQRDVRRERIPGLPDDSAIIAQKCHVRASARPAKILWWSFNSPDNHFEAFIDKAIQYISDNARTRAEFSSLDEKVRTLVDLLAKHRVLAILDAFEFELHAFAARDAGALRDTQKILVDDYGDDRATGGDNGLATWPASSTSGAYDTGHFGRGNDYRACRNPYVKLFLEQAAALPPISRVVIASRVPPEDLDFLSGVQHLPLGHLTGDDAANFLRAEGLRGRPQDFERVAAEYGNHPLALRLLARKIARHPIRPGDVTSAEEFNPSDVVRRDIHIVAVAYDALDPDTRHLLSGLAAFRTPATFDGIQAAFQSPTASAAQNVARLQEQLDALVDAGMVQFDRENRAYELHAIIRRYAYDRLGAHERRVIHERLANYFAGFAIPKTINGFGDLVPTIERFHHRVGAGQFDAALRLYMERLSRPLYRELGAYHTCIELLSALMPDGFDSTPKVASAARQRWVLNSLAAAVRRIGNPRRAVVLYRRLLKIRADEPPVVMAMVRQNLADQLRELGKLKAAMEVLEVTAGDLPAAAPAPKSGAESGSEIGDSLTDEATETATAPAPLPGGATRTATGRIVRADVAGIAPAPLPPDVADAEAIFDPIPLSPADENGAHPPAEPPAGARSRRLVELPDLPPRGDDVDFDWYGATIHDDELDSQWRILGPNGGHSPSRNPAADADRQRRERRAARRLQASQRIQIGRLRAILGEYDAALADFDAALRAFEAADTEATESAESLVIGAEEENLALPASRAHLIWAYRGMVDLLRGHTKSAIFAARQSHKLARATGGYNVARADWLVGAAVTAHAAVQSDEAARAAGLNEAKPYLADALAGCRRLGLVSLEPAIVLAWARWYRAAGDLPAAKQHADEALAIAERCEYRLMMADIHNFAAEVALDARDFDDARYHATLALDLASCDGGRFVYRSAFDLATRLRAAAERTVHGRPL